MDNSSFGVLAIIITVAVMNVIVLLHYIVEMAETRGRSIGYWLLFSLIFTPVIGIVLLACIGETREQRDKRIRYEEKLRQKIRQQLAWDDNHLYNSI